VFSIAFGAMLLSIVLWDQQVWGWTALQTGLAVAPGPLMVPLFSFLVAGRLIARFGPGRVIAAGATIYAAGATWWTLRSGLTPNYVGEMLPGMLMTGIGVGLTLPTFMSTGASALPPRAFATGSAVVNMLRQVGLAVGVAVLVAVIGTPHTGAQQLSAFQHGWIVIASTSLLAALAGAVLLRPRRDRARESARWSGAAATPPALPERQ
jgi:MFS family permease